MVNNITAKISIAYCFLLTYSQLLSKQETITTTYILNKKELAYIWKSINDSTDLDFLDSNKIQAKGSEKELGFFKKVIKEIDIKPKQIKLSINAFQGRKNFNIGYGINWSGIYNRLSSLSYDTNFNFIGLGGTRGDIPTPTAPLDQRHSNLYVDPTKLSINLFTGNILGAQPEDALPNETTKIQIPIVFGGPDLNTKRLNIILNAFEYERKIKNLSKVNVLINEGEVSKILAGTSIPIYIKVIEPIQEAVTTETILTYENIGTSFEVVAKIIKDKIILNFRINTSFILGGSTVCDNIGLLNFPPVLEAYRATDSIILKNGESCAIFAGIFEDIYNANNDLPGVAKIPVLTNIFGAKGAYHTTIEDLLIITAEIIS